MIGHLEAINAHISSSPHAVNNSSHRANLNTHISPRSELSTTTITVSTTAVWLGARVKRSHVKPKERDYSVRMASTPSTRTTATVNIVLNIQPRALPSLAPLRRSSPSSTKSVTTQAYGQPISRQSSFFPVQPALLVSINTCARPHQRPIL